MTHPRRLIEVVLSLGARASRSQGLGKAGQAGRLRSRGGLGSCTSDLNPVAVLLNEVLIETSPGFGDWSPVRLGALGVRPSLSLGARASRSQGLGKEGQARHLRSRRGLGSRDSQHKGWYSRGYLPHFDHPDAIQMVTFRLADSLPPTVLDTLERELKDQPDSERRKRIEAYLDAGHGSCHLKDERLARLVEDALLYFDGERYRLLAWVIMPNHVHVLIETMPGFPLSDVLHSWKSFTAKEANKVLGTSGRFWQPEYFDRYIRDECHYESAIHYIHENPVKAGLVQRAEDWRYSSASRGAMGARPS